MESKKAFVFDTNFIVQNPELDKVIETLKEEYTIYVTQISIDERVAQNCREMKDNFDKLNSIKAKYGSLSSINFEELLETEINNYKRGIPQKYNQYFGNNIIPFVKDINMLERLIFRANEKLPPFSKAENSSDKGFKDCLLWFSLLDFFKENGEAEIVFLTDDNGFKNSKDYLIKEFQEETGKTLEIKPNIAYKELTTKKVEQAQKDPTEPLPNFSVIRENLNTIMDSIIWNFEEDYYGNPHWTKTFYTTFPINEIYVETIFSNLKNILSKLIFISEIDPSDFLEFDDRIINNVQIPFKEVEKLLVLYEDILSNYPQYLQSFYFAIAEKLNENYANPENTANPVDNGDLPF